METEAESATTADGGGDDPAGTGTGTGTPAVVSTIKITSIDHKNNNKDNHGIGKWFHFYQASIKDFDDTVYVNVMNSRTEVYAQVVLWPEPNGGSIGDAHGRFSSQASAGDWEVGDKLLIYDEAYCSCVSQGAQCATDKGELKLLMRSKLQGAVSDLTVARKAPIIHARETPSSFPSHPSFMLGHASGQVGM